MSDHETPLDTENDKSKRVLTEAQRLAFLKGREKRMANIEKKRQERLEQNDETNQPPTPVAESKPKQPRRRTPKSKDESTIQAPIPIKASSTPITPAEDFDSDSDYDEIIKSNAIPEMPILRRQTNHEDQAEKIANLVLERLRKQDNNTSTPPHSTVKKTRKSASVPRVKNSRAVSAIRPRTRSEPEIGEHHENHIHIPERSFNWM